jgi:hypothetical protein
MRVAVSDLSRPSTAVAAVLFLATIAGGVQPRSRADCEAAYPAALGRDGKDAPWVPTYDAVTLAMLSIARVTPRDRLLDLGAGDGRIVIAAAKAPFGASAVGIEFDHDLARLASCLVQAEGVSDRVRIVEGDIFQEHFGDATVVTMFLLSRLNLCIRHRLLAMPPGTRVVSHQFGMADWEPDQSVTIQGRHVSLWVVPARVGGVWDFEDSEEGSFSVDLRQTFDTLSGRITRDGGHAALVAATVKGSELRFAFEAAGSTVEFSGTVRGQEITGVLSTGRSALTAVGRLRGAPRAAPWAEMPADCRRYYEPAR